MLNQRLSLTASVALMGLVSACSILGPRPSHPQPGVVGGPGAQTGAAPDEQASPTGPTGPGEQHAPPRQYHLSAATTALVTQSRQQASGGNYVAAFQILERAQRIEPENPLVWVEMGQVRLQEGNAPQAHSLGRKALQLASGDPAAQSQAWHLIADSLKAQGKDPEAAEAQRHADALAAR
jgi:tetratricopeptide (TPR) repeat protein